MLAAIAAFIANPVLLVHDTGRVLYHATYRATADEAMAAWSLGVVDPAHRIVVPVIGPHGTAGSLWRLPSTRRSMISPLLRLSARCA